MFEALKNIKFLQKKKSVTEIDRIEGNFDDNINEPDERRPRYEWKRGRLFMLGFIIVLLVLVLMLVISCQPKKGNIMYGICSVLSESLVTYPETITDTYVEQYPLGVRIYFTHTDAFGQYKMEILECSYTNDQRGLLMKNAFYNRQPIEQTRITEFNQTLPAIVEADPDLTLPADMPNLLRNLYRQD